MTPEQKQLADAVAAELNLKPDPAYTDHWSRIYALPDGGRLYFSTGRVRGHLHISASVADGLREHRPYHRDGEGPKTSINVSEGKNAKRIAADVRRRLLPEHDRETAECRASKARHDENNAQRILALTRVAAPLGEHVRCDDRTGEPHALSIDRQGKFSLTVKTFCDSLKLEVEASPEIAGKIAALLATL
jgi:hypothetical protein